MKNQCKSCIHYIEDVAKRFDESYGLCSCVGRSGLNLYKSKNDSCILYKWSGSALDDDSLVHDLQAIEFRSGLTN